jgi:capsular polysaccharide biosynthesis protein
MELVLVMRVLRRRWWLILLPVIVAAVFALPQFLNNEQTGAGGYQTNFRFTAAQSASNVNPRDGDYQDIWLASELLVNAFIDWAQSSSFKEELAVQTNNAEMLNGLNIVADNSRSVGIVYMSHPDRTSLELLANAAVTVLQSRNQAYFPHLGASPAQVTLLDTITILDAPPPLTNRFAPVLQLGAAFFAGLVLAVIAEYFDNRLRYKDELEKQGLKVLGTVPKYR